MAQMTATSTIMDRFEQRLATAMGDWRQLPEIVVEWAAWDSGSRMDFLTDWPVVEDRTAALLAVEPSLSPNDERKTRLSELRALVERNRPILARLEARIHEA